MKNNYHFLFFIILVFLFIVFRQYRQKRKANVLLASQNEQILQQKEEIEAQRDLVTKQKDKIEEIQKKTRTLVFVTCEISNSENIVATASGVWKILKIKTSNLGPGG